MNQWEIINPQDVTGESNSVTVWELKWTILSQECLSGRKIPMFTKAFKSIGTRQTFYEHDLHSTKKVTVRWLCPEEYTFRKLKGTL